MNRYFLDELDLSLNFPTDNFVLPCKSPDIIANGSTFFRTNFILQCLPAQHSYTCHLITTILGPNSK